MIIQHDIKIGDLFSVTLTAITPMTLVFSNGDTKELTVPFDCDHDTLMEFSGDNESYSNTFIYSQSVKLNMHTIKLPIKLLTVCNFNMFYRNAINRFMLL